MKVAPLLGLAPQPLQQEVLAAYKQFVSLPLLQPAVIAFGFSADNAMVALAVAHIAAVALLVLPSGSLPAKAAGLWAMIAMAGAEYCTRAADVAPPMTPPQFKWHAQVLGSITHLFLFLCGAYCATRTSSIGLVSVILASRQPPATKNCDGKGEDVKDAKLPTKVISEASDASLKTDVQKDVHEATRKRTTTPPPKASKNAGYRQGSAPQRGSAALS